MQAYCVCSKIQNRTFQLGAPVFGFIIGPCNLVTGCNISSLKTHMSLPNHFQACVNSFSFRADQRFCASFQAWSCRPELHCGCMTAYMSLRVTAQSNDSTAPTLG